MSHQPLNTTRAPRYPSPLWLLSLFVALIDSVALAAVLATGGTIKFIFTIFAVLFPFVVLAVFVWLLLRHTGKLYSPHEYGGGINPGDYIEALNKKTRVEQLAFGAATIEAVSDFIAHDGPNEGAIREELTTRLERAVAETSVSVDVSELAADGGVVVQVPVMPDTTVGSFLDAVWIDVSGSVKPFTYNQDWILVDQGGKVYDSMGTRWAEGQGFSTDERSLAEVGIAPESKLSARPLPSASANSEKPRRAEGGRWQKRLRLLVDRVAQAARADGLEVTRVKGEHVPRLIVSHGGRDYGLYVMAGPDPSVSWVSRAAEAAQRLGLEQGIKAIPVLTLEVTPTALLRKHAQGAGVEVMWCGRDGLHETPWVTQPGARV